MSFCLSVIFLSCKEVHSQRTKQTDKQKKNHVTPKNSVAHHLLPAMQHENHITIYN